MGHGTSLVFQWLRLCTSTAGGMGSIPGQGTKIPHSAWCSQKEKNGPKTLTYTSLKKYTDAKKHMKRFFT